MPWKNGQGMTSEIAIFPPIARFPDDEFVWRLSSALIKSANHFSQFKNYDRLLVVWKGDGLMLNASEVLPFKPFQFSGEELMDCRLLGGEVVDLGLIYRKDQVKAEMKVLTLTASHSQTITLNQRMHFLICAEGTFFADDALIATEDTLQVQGFERLELKTSSAAKVILVSIGLHL